MKMRIKVKNIICLCTLGAAFSASADTLYWVDTKTFNSTYNQNSQRYLLSTEKSSEESNDNYNWATGFSVDGDGKPTYTYAETVYAPTADTDVILDYSKNAFTYQMGGSMVLNANQTFSIKSLAISGCNNNWAMFNMQTSSHFQIAGDLTYGFNGYVRFTSGNLSVGGDIYNNNTNGYNNLSLGAATSSLESFSAENVYLSRGNGNSMITFSVGRAATTYDKATGVIRGVIDFGSNAGKVRFDKMANFEQFLKVGGLKGSAGTVTAEAAGVNYTVVLTNPSEQTYSGVVTNAEGASVNIVMDGTATQVLSGENSFSGYIQMENGTLLARTAAGSTHGKLTLNGGRFGAVGNAAVSSAEFNGGGFIFADKDEFLAGSGVSLISIAGEFAKTASDKIAIDFNGLDASELVGITYDLITAGSLSGMSSEVDADEYFAAENLLNAVADFGWNGNMLQVTFGTVPEPAGVAALLGLAAFAFAARRRRG